MIYLCLSLVILAGLTGVGYLVASISRDLRGMESAEDKETLQNIEIWRNGQ